MVLLAVVLIFLLFGNWLISETLIFIPIHLVTRVTSLGWWGLAFLSVLFIAWCIGED